MPSDLQPSETAERMARAVVENDDLQREMLRETVATGAGQRLEAGRTLCGVDAEPRAAAERGEQSVGLQLCPADDPTAIVHTHPTPQGLRTPVHSLPDLANVAFEDVDASVVVGAEWASVVHAADDRAAMQTAMQDALGMEIDSARDVIAAYNEGRIPDPAVARRNVVDAFGELVDTAPTGHLDVVEQASGQAVAADSLESGGAMYQAAVPFEYLGDDEPAEPDGRVQTLRRRGRVGAELMKYSLPTEEIRGTAVGTTVGLLTSRAVESLLFE